MLPSGMICEATLCAWIFAAWALICSGVSRIKPAGGAVNIDDLPALINGKQPDVLIVDGATPACLDALEALSLHSPGIDTLLISGDASADFLLHAMRIGVREVIPASSSAEALEAALVRLQH